MKWEQPSPTLTVPGVLLVIVKHHCGCSQERLCQDVLCMAQQSTMGWAPEIISSRFRYFVLLSALDMIRYLNIEITK